MLVSTPCGVEGMWTSSVQREVREGVWNKVRCRGRGSLHGWVGTVGQYGVGVWGGGGVG